VCPGLPSRLLVPDRHGWLFVSPGFSSQMTIARERYLWGWLHVDLFSPFLVMNAVMDSRDE
jgi:hypothetical protein